MVQVTVPLLSIFMKSKIKKVQGQKNMQFQTLFVKLVKSKVFAPQLLNFSDFIIIKKIQDYNLNHFQQLWSHYFPPPMNFIIFGISTYAAYFKSSSLDTFQQYNSPLFYEQTEITVLTRFLAGWIGSTDLGCYQFLTAQVKTVL